MLFGVGLEEEDKLRLFELGEFVLSQFFEECDFFFAIDVDGVFAVARPVFLPFKGLFYRQHCSILTGLA